MNSWESGIALYNAGNFAEALDVFRNLQVDAGRKYELAYYLGLCYIRLGDQNNAIDFLQIASEDSSDFARVYQAMMLLSWLKIQADRLDEAEIQILDIIEGGFESPQIWAILGFCYWKKGRIQESVECYGKALKIDSENANAANGLGYVLADSGIDPDEGVRLCRNALKHFPDNSSYEDSLGWALHKSGKQNEAEMHLKNALSRAPESRIIKRHLEVVQSGAPSY